MLTHREAARIAVVAALLLAPSASFACRCIEPGPPAGNYRRAAAVFVGTVTSVKQDAEQTLTATMTVTQSWKKPLGSEVDVSTEAGTCAATLTPGVTYLLYVREAPARPGFSTERCMGNLPIEAADKPLAWLKRNVKPPAKATRP